MAMVVRCPNKACGKPCLVGEEHLGRTVHCPHCKQALSIPTLETSTLNKPPSQQEGSTAPDGTPPTLSESSARETPPPAPTRSPSLGNGLPERLGRFEVRACLGAGSFGTVYLVYDPQLDREMALKVPQPGTLQNPQAVERFLREARAAGRLHHPHIVPVFEASGAGGDYYIASAYVPGHTLEHALAAGNVDFRQAARTAHALAEALAYAHRLGIVHRDVKPSNVLLDEQGEAYLLDFGLAYRLYAATKHLTHDGMILGTPAYMAPEQAAGRSGEPQPASDQYSLGVVLYEMLTRQTPFSGTPQVVLYHTLNSEPPVPRTLNPNIPPELERICLKAMARQPENRYPTCQELADDLREWLKGPEYPAPPPSPAPPRPRRRWRRAFVPALVLLLVAATGVAGWLTWQYRDDARRARAEADLVRYRHQVSLAGLEWLANDPLRADELLDSCPEHLRRWEWHYLKNLGQFAEYTLTGHGGPVTCVGFSADGKRVASGSEDQTVRVWDAQTGKELLTLKGHTRTVRGVCFSRDGKYLASAAGPPWAPPMPVRAPRPVAPAAMPRGAETRAPASSFGGELVALLEAPPDKGKPDGKGDGAKPAPPEVELPKGHGEVKVWDAQSGKEVLCLDGPADLLESVAFSPDSKFLVTGASDGTVEVWDAVTGKRRRTWRGFAIQPAVGVVFSPDSRWVAFGSDRAVRVWRTSDKETRILGHHDFPVRAVAFSPDGKRVGSIDQRGVFRTWNVSEPIPGPRSDLGKGDTWFVLAQPPGQPAAPAGDANSPWRQSAVTLELRFADEDGVVAGAAFSADGQRLAAAWGAPGDATTVTICAGTTGRELQSLRGHTGPVAGLAFSPDGLTLASAGTDGTVKLWRATRWLDLPLLDGGMEQVRGAAYSADGLRLAVVGRENRQGLWSDCLKVWDAAGGLLFTRLGPYGAVAFSPDGRRVAVAGNDFLPAPKAPPADDDKKKTDSRPAPLTGMERESFVLLEEAPGPGEPPATQQPTPTTPIREEDRDGPVFVRLVDARTGKTVRSLRGHGEPIARLVFSANGRRLAAVSPARLEMRAEKRTRTVVQEGRKVLIEETVTVTTLVGGAVTVWDTGTGRTLLSLTRLGNISAAAAFSPDGERLALCVRSDEGGEEEQDRGPTSEVRVWDIGSNKEVLTIPCEDGPAWDLAYSPDGRRLAAASGRVKVWDAGDGDLLFKLSARGQFLYQVVFSPDGERLVTAGRIGSLAEVKVWDADGTELATVDQFPTQGLALTFATDGRRLLFAGTGSRGALDLRAWDGTPLETRTPLPRAPRRVFSVFNPPAGEVISPPKEKMPAPEEDPPKKVPEKGSVEKTQAGSWTDSVVVGYRFGRSPASGRASPSRAERTAPSRPDRLSVAEAQPRHARTDGGSSLLVAVKAEQS